MATTRSRRILVVTDLSQMQGQEIQRGVVREVHSLRGWRVESCLAVPAQVRDRLSEGAVDGVVAHINTPPMANCLQLAARRGTVVVNTSTALDDLEFPQVCIDAVAVGRALGKALSAHGFTATTYFGNDHYRFTRDRIAGIRSVLGPAGVDFVRLRGERNVSQAWFERQLARIVDPCRPVAVTLAAGQYALTCYAAAQARGYAIPDQIAIYDLYFDLAYAESLDPPLSGLAFSREEHGRVAARELLRLLDGGRPRRQPLLLPPGGIVERRSSDTWAVSEELRRALALVRDREGLLTVDELVAHLGTSRRPLEKRFRAELDRSPHEHILGVRLDRGRDLLQHTDRPVTDIALTCGFCSSAHFGTHFRRRFGCSPTALRRRTRR